MALTGLRTLFSKANRKQANLTEIQANQSAIWA